MISKKIIAAIMICMFIFCFFAACSGKADSLDQSKPANTPSTEISSDNDKADQFDKSENDGASSLDSSTGSYSGEVYFRPEQTEADGQTTNDSGMTEEYAIRNFEIECADAYITNITETIYYKGDKFEKAVYDIAQGKNGKIYSAELYFDDKEYANYFTLKNEKGENLLTLSAGASGYDNDSAVGFLDADMDGYADIRFLKEEGAMNSEYALYVWDDSAETFVKVKFDGMLSYFESRDGYLLNWLRESADSGVIQKLVWKDKSTLIIESEEPYKAD